MEHCFTFKYLQIISSLIKYNRILMRCVLLVELSIQIVFNKIALVLYWCNVVSKLYYYCFRKFLVHNKCDKISLTTINYASIYFYFELLPMFNKPPTWLFISACITKSASAYQSAMDISPISNVRSSSHVSWS